MMKDIENKYPAAYVYEQTGEYGSKSYQVVIHNTLTLTAVNVQRLKEVLNFHQINPDEICFLTRQQIAGLNVIPIENVRPFEPQEKEIIKQPLDNCVK